MNGKIAPLAVEAEIVVKYKRDEEAENQEVEKERAADRRCP